MPTRHLSLLLAATVLVATPACATGMLYPQRGPVSDRDDRAYYNRGLRDGREYEHIEIGGEQHPRPLEQHLQQDVRHRELSAVAQEFERETGTKRTAKTRFERQGGADAQCGDQRHGAILARGTIRHPRRANEVHHRLRFAFLRGLYRTNFQRNPFRSTHTP